MILEPLHCEKLVCARAQPPTRLSRSGIGTQVLEIVVSIDIYLQYIPGWKNTKGETRDGEMKRWISSGLGERWTYGSPAGLESDDQMDLERT